MAFGQILIRSDATPTPPRRIDNVPRITDPQPNNYPSFAFGTVLKRPGRWTEEEPTNNSV